MNRKMAAAGFDRDLLVNIGLNQTLANRLWGSLLLGKDPGELKAGCFSDPYTQMNLFRSLSHYYGWGFSENQIDALDIEPEVPTSLAGHPSHYPVLEITHPNPIKLFKDLWWEILSCQAAITNRIAFDAIDLVVQQDLPLPLIIDSRYWADKLSLSWNFMSYETSREQGFKCNDILRAHDCALASGRPNFDTKPITVLFAMLASPLWLRRIGNWPLLWIRGMSCTGPAVGKPVIVRWAKPHTDLILGPPIGSRDLVYQSPSFAIEQNFSD